MRTRGRWLLLVLLVAIAGGVRDANAQGASQAELRGAVTDETGGALPGVTITATQQETGATRTAVTSATGTYVMTALPVGTYDVTAELSGFATVVQNDVRLAVGATQSIAFRLTVASLEETITVTGEAPLIETKRSDLGGQIEPTQVAELPLNGRNWLDLVALVPGARGDPGAIQAGASGSDMAKYNVDGVDVSNQCCGGSNQGYSQENVAEFQVLTNRFDAEYGRVGGAIINVVTKSGTNTPHGTGFGFFRNDRFDARNFYTHEVAPFDEKQAGLNAGGPIVRDKVHFFASYEHQRRSITALPNTGYAAFDVPAPQDITRHYATFRLDAQAGLKHRLFLRGSAYTWEQLNVDVGGDTPLEGAYARPSDNFDVSVGDTWVITDRLVYEVRTGFSRIDNRLIPNSPTPRLDFPSISLGSPTNAPQWWKEMNIQLNQSLSYFLSGWHGEHSMKTGFQYFRPSFWGAFPQPAYGAYTFNEDPVDVHDPSTYPAPIRYSIPLGDTSYEVVNPIYAAFFQDNWTLNRHLTLNLGVRYDLETGTKNSDYENPIQPGQRSLDSNNVSPRLGFAWDLTGDGRTVIRGGYGRHYDKVMLNLTSNERRLALGELIPVTVLDPVFGDPLGGLTYEDYKSQHIPANMTIIANDFGTPVNDQGSIGLAKQFGTRYAVEADFVHAEGRDEPMSPSVNFFEDPETGLPLDPAIHGRPYPDYVNVTRYQSTGRSRYDGLQMGFSGRRGATGWTSHLQFTGSYTLSWTWNNHSSNRGGGATNPFNLDDEWSYAGTDQRHRFTLNAIASLPWDLQFSAIYFAGSERPINIGTNLDPFGLGYSGRWLDEAGHTLPRYGARTGKWDHKLDLRLAKRLRAGRVTVEGVIDVFNVLNRFNLTNYGTNYFSRTYLQPSNSTNLFYQPRQVQLGFRISY